MKHAPYPLPRHLVLRLLAHPAWPGILQWPVLASFLALLLILLFGPADNQENIAGTMTWLLWWPSLALLFLFVGRIWCAVCPFSLVSDLVRRFAGLNRHVPMALRRSGFWLMTGLFMFLTWAEVVYDVTDAATASAMLLLIIFTCVILAGVLFERRAWCRYLCPLGGMAGLYSRVSPVALRGRSAVCHRCTTLECSTGSNRAAGCPMFEFPRAMDSNTSCNWCGNCVKACPYDGLSAGMRVPGSEVWTLRRPRLEEATLAVILAGMITLLNLQEAFKNDFFLLPGLGFGASFAIWYAVIVIAALALALAAGHTAAFLDRESGPLNFARFGYGLIPAVLFAQISHTASETLEDGGHLLDELARILRLAWRPTGHLVNDEIIMVLHVLCFTIGAGFSLLIAWKSMACTAGRERRLLALLPFALLLALFVGLNLWLRVGEADS